MAMCIKTHLNNAVFSISDPCSLLLVCEDELVTEEAPTGFCYIYIFFNLSTIQTALEKSSLLREGYKVENILSVSTDEVYPGHFLPTFFLYFNPTLSFVP